jgi:hypothetical protein
LRRLIWFFAILLSAAPAGSALACSLTDEYLDIQSRYEPDEQSAALEALYETTKKSNPLLADDIAYHLSSISPFKPYGFLQETYETLNRGGEPGWALFGPIFDRDAPYVEKLSFGPSDRALTPEERRDLKLSILAVLSWGDYPEAKPFFESLIADPNLTPVEAGFTTRYFGENREYGRAVQLIATRVLPKLGGMNESDARLVVGDAFSAFPRNGDGWREDPVANREWPEIALTLYWHMQDRYRAGYNVHPFIESLRPDDFRVRPQVTLALAEMFDEHVEAWAIAEVSEPANWQRWSEDGDISIYGGDHPGRLPVEALVRGFGDERDEALDELFCQGGDQRLLVIEALGVWGEFGDEIYRLTNASGLEEIDREFLLEALLKHEVRESRFFDQDLITAMVTTGRVEAREDPPSCS